MLNNSIGQELAEQRGNTSGTAVIEAQIGG